MPEDTQHNYYVVVDDDAIKVGATIKVGPDDPAVVTEPERVDLYYFAHSRDIDDVTDIIVNDLDRPIRLAVVTPLGDIDLDPAGQPWCEAGWQVVGLEPYTSIFGSDGERIVDLVRRRRNLDSGDPAREKYWSALDDIDTTDQLGAAVDGARRALAVGRRDDVFWYAAAMQHPGPEIIAYVARRFVGTTASWQWTDYELLARPSVTAFKQPLHPDDAPVRTPAVNTVRPPDATTYYRIIDDPAVDKDTILTDDVDQDCVVVDPELVDLDYFAQLSDVEDFVSIVTGGGRDKPIRLAVVTPLGDVEVNRAGQAWCDAGWRVDGFERYTRMFGADGERIVDVVRRRLNLTDGSPQHTAYHEALDAMIKHDPRGVTAEAARHALALAGLNDLFWSNVALQLRAPEVLAEVASPLVGTTPAWRHGDRESLLGPAKAAFDDALHAEDAAAVS